MVDAAKLDGALARALTAFMQDENLETAFRDLLTSLMEMTASEYAFVGAFRESGSHFRVDALAWCGADWHPTEDEPALPLVAPTLLDEVRSRAQPVAVSVGEGIPRPVGFPPGAPQVQSFVGLPLIHGDEVLGVVALANAPSGYDEAAVTSLQPVFACGSMVAAANREHARSESRSSEQHQHAMATAAVRGVVDALVVCDARGIIHSANPATAELFGWEESELVGQNVSVLMPAHFAKEHDGYLESYTRTGVARVMGTAREVFARRRDGKEVPVEIHLHETEHEGERFFVGTLKDISGRKATERQLRDLNRQLEDRAEEIRSIHLENSRINEMNSFLLTAESLSEVGQVVERFVPELMPGVSAGFYLFQGLGEAEPVVNWGVLHRELAFRKSACWAVRRGQPHQGGTHDLPCPHLRDHDAVWSLCLPVLGPDGLSGVLSLVACDEVSEGYLTQAERVGSEVAGRLGTAVSSMNLRSRLEDESTRDHLTRLHNRRYFDEQFAREIRRSRRSGDPLAVIVVDVDHFKKFNDEHGHDAGDLVLQELARTMNTHVRGEDVVCRLGGEEFVLLLPGSSLDNAIRRADDLRVRVSEMEVTMDGATQLQVHISAGVAVWPLHGDSEEAVLVAADQALYQAKRQGRNQVCRAAVSAQPQAGNNP